MDGLVHAHAGDPCRLRPSRSCAEITGGAVVPEPPQSCPCSALPIVHALVVDDDALVLFAVQEALELCGYRTSAAANGARALEIDAACPADVLVTDLDMPGMDGLELIRRLRAGRPGLPALILTGRPPPSRLAALLADGATPTALVRKPATLAELVAVLDGILTKLP